MNSDTLTLFDPRERTDTTSSGLLEPAYDWMNRSSWPVAIRARTLCNAWFSLYPHDHASHLATRFKSRKHDVHNGAYFELLLHELLSSMQYTINLEARVPQSKKQVDFLIESPSRQIAIEATSHSGTPFEKHNHPNALQVESWIQKIEDPNFVVNIKWLDIPTITPSQADLTRKLTSHLRHWDPVQNPSLMDKHGGDCIPPLSIQLGGTTLEVAFYLKQKAERGASYLTIGLIGPEFSRPNPTESIRDRVLRKAVKLKSLASSTFRIVAVCASDLLFSTETEPRNMLFGMYDGIFLRDHVALSGTPRWQKGVWFENDGSPHRDYLDAVWVFYRAGAANPMPAGEWACIYLNPNTSPELPQELRQFTHAEVIDNTLKVCEGVDLNRFLEIPEIPADELYG